MGVPPPPTSRAQVLTVSSELRTWERMLSGQGWRNRFLVTVYMMSPWLCPPAMACITMSVVLSADVPSLLRGVCGVFVIYSSGTSAFLWGFRRHRLIAVLRMARQLTQQAESWSDWFDLRMTEVTAARLRRIRSIGFAYVKTGSALTAMEQFVGSPAIPICYDFDDTYVRLGMAVTEAIKWGMLATCFFSMWLFIITILMAMETHYKALCARLSRAAGRQQLVPCIDYLIKVFQMEAAVKDIFYTSLLHMLAGALLVPLINTYQLLFGPRSLFSVLTLSTMPLVYGSMSIMGDRLALGCEQVSQAAYDGPWTEEPPSVVRLRIMLMQSCTRNAPFTMKGLGDFTRASAYGVLKTWYQYLNLLIGSMSAADQKRERMAPMAPSPDEP